MKHLIVVVALLVLFGTATAQRPSAEPYTYTSVAEFAQITEGFSILASILRGTETGLAYGGSGPFTFIAPSDEAFAELSESELKALLDDPDRLAALLEAHVVRDATLLGTLGDRVRSAGNLRTQTLAGDAVQIEQDASGGLFVNDVPVVGTEIAAANGTILVVDSLLGMGAPAPRGE